MRTWRLLAPTAFALALGACETVPVGPLRGEEEKVEIVPESPGDPDPDEEDAGRRIYREYDRWPRLYNEGLKEPFEDAETNPPPEDMYLLYGEEIEEADVYIRIGTFNLKGFGPNKAEFRVNPRGKKKTDKRRTMAAFIASYVRAMELDVVAFQEVVGSGNGGLRELAAAMSGSGYVLAVGDDDDFIRLIGRKVLFGQNKERCPIFYRTDRIQPEGGAKGKVMIATINGSERHATYAYLGVQEKDVPADKRAQRFRFVMTCQHAPPPDRPVSERAAYWSAVPGAVMPLAGIDTDVILAGDLNTDPRTSVVPEQLRLHPVLGDPPDGAGFLNRHGYVNQRIGGGTTIRGQNVYDDLLWREPTEQDFADLKVIEYGFDKMFRSGSGNIDKDAQNRFSDHYPAWARFHRGKDSQ